MCEILDPPDREDIDWCRDCGKDVEEGRIMLCADCQRKRRLEGMREAIVDIARTHDEMS